MFPLFIELGKKMENWITDKKIPITIVAAFFAQAVALSWAGSSELAGLAGEDRVLREQIRNNHASIAQIRRLIEVANERADRKMDSLLRVVSNK